jgi:mycofactocin glycosyltransferase
MNKNFLNAFTFSLAEKVCLRKNESQYFLFSNTPLRFLQINLKLYEIIENLISGYSLHQMLKNKKEGARKEIIKILFSLVNKGYLSFDLHHAGINENEYPKVSVVIPVKNRPGEIADCLSSLRCVDYPREKLEILVVDDGSLDKTPNVIQSFNVRLIRNPVSKGASFSRNLGSKKATGEILAFLDSDCTVSDEWLKENVLFSLLEGVGAVGGLVKSYFTSSKIDRYESAFSSLNMGNRLLFEAQVESNLYVPSCNMFVQREIFLKMGGFKDGMHLGEDVDLCWRLRKAGTFLIYHPNGAIAHKHRNRLVPMLKRRFEYGTSEANLYLSHRHMKKKIKIPLFAGLSFILFLTAIFLGSPVTLMGSILVLGLDFAQKSHFLKSITETMPAKNLLISILKNAFSFYYYASFYFVRYFLILICLFGFIFNPLWLSGIIFLLICSRVDYSSKKPSIIYINFLCFYILEHLAYQTGVLAGCIKYRYFRCYVPAIEVSCLLFRSYLKKQ